VANLMNNLLRLAVGPMRERGVLETVRSIRSCLQARRLEDEEGFDRRFGTDTGSNVSLAGLRLNGHDLDGLWRYWPMSEGAFHRLMDAVDIPHEDFVFIDFGSGKGRALLMAADYPFRRVVGVELSPALHEAAVQNCRRYRSARQRCRHIEPLCIDATAYELPAEPSVIYLYQPFGAPVLAQVLARLDSSLKAVPRPLWLAYANPLFHRQILESGRFVLRDSGPPLRPGEFAWTLYQARI
jgi:SAM-dependent methyltransferase